MSPLMGTNCRNLRIKKVQIKQVLAVLVSKQFTTWGTQMEACWAKKRFIKFC